MRRIILGAIADVVDHGGDESAAMAALRSVDPILRFWARRRLRLALTEVLMAAPGERVDRATRDNGHVLRLTYLSIAGALQPTQADGEIATIRAFEISRRAAQAPPRHRWWFTGALGLVTLLAVCGGGWMGLGALRKGPPLKPDSPPHPSGAFAHGGVPDSGGPVLDRALGRDLPDFLIALDAWRQARGEAMPTGKPMRLLEELETLRDRLEARPVAAALGEPAAHWLSGLLKLTKILATTRQLDRLTKPYTQTVVALNDALAARGLGYYLDSDVIHATGDVRYVILYVFRVKRVRRFRAGSRTVTALELRRLDKLNWGHAALGFTRREHHEALVLLDSVDETLVNYLLPALGSSRLRLVDNATAGAGLTWPTECSIRAAEAIRSELGRVPGLTLEAAEHLVQLLARRQALLEGWQQTLSKSGYGLVAPTGLTFDWNYQRALKHIIEPKQLQEMAQIDRALRPPRMQRTLAVLRDVVARSVAHHEIQHRLDYDWLVSRTLPGALRDRVGPLVRRGRVSPHVRSARNELSAYLAALARAQHTTGLELALIARFALNQRHVASPEGHAAQIILEGLAALLGMALSRRPNAGHAGDRARYAMLYLHLTHRAPSTLRRAAGRLWEDLFGMGLPELVELEIQASPPGR